MSGFLLDTNCISELVRVKPDRGVMEWMDAADESLLYLSVLTLGEIRIGLASLAQGKRRTRLETWLELELQARFARRILFIDAPVADRWGLLAAQARVKGATLPIIDGLLAATALHYNLTVVSRNAADFASTQTP
jgi:predicted nucleic acid-binding protein